LDKTGEGVNQSHVLFDRFVQATTCKGTLKAFQELCDFLELKPNEYRVFYHKLKSKLNYWKAKALWAKLDKRASHKEYKKGRACANSKCLIIGAGPCGLRTAIELAFLGAKVVLLEKRDAFSRNNVLHLWPFTIQDLRGLGAKKFYGKFCAGSIDHISIRQLQLMLLKMALLLGIEIHVNAEFKGLIEPPEDQENERIGWRAEVHPRTHPVNELEFDVIIGADGRRNTLSGFRRKEFRGKLAIAITANFINRNTTAEAKVEEISGVAFIFNQKFFQDLREATGIDLENIVYYKDDTHYFVMTAKKQSLLEKGVILHDYVDTEMLLSRANVDQAALLSYAREAADFSTNHQLPTLDFAINHYGQPDVAMFDFTCMYASENAALIRQRNGHQLLVALVGDSLLEPFWPMGTGIARGFLAALDSAWMVRSWAQGASALEVLAERESIYRLLPQTTPENVSKNYSHYTVDPTTRYPNISLHLLRPNQVRHLIDTGENREIRIDMENVVNSSTPKLTRNESIARSSKLLNWCQRQTEGYRGVSVSDLTTSWKSGLALCALIHRYRPDLIDFESLDEKDVEKNNQLAFDVSEKEFGISPIMTGKEMSVVVEPDKLSMVMYLTQFYEMFKDTVPPGGNPEEKAALIASTKSPISFLSKLGQSINISRKRNPKDKKEKEMDGVGKRRKTSQAGQSEDQGVGNERSTALTERRIDTTAAANNNKVKSMATQLLAKFEENAPAQSTGLKRQVGQSSCSNNRALLCYWKWRTPQESNMEHDCQTLFSASVLHLLFGVLALCRCCLYSKICPKKKPSRFFIEQWHRVREIPTDSPLPSPASLRQRYVRMYTGGVSSLAEQIASQLQTQDDPRLSLEKRDLGSLRKEFPQNIGGSDVCFFCRKRVYVMERLSAEGKFFHRSCFKCDYCGTTLRLSSYAFDVEDGKFYCKPHYCYRLSGQAQRKRPAPATAPLHSKVQTCRLPCKQSPVTVDAPGRAAAAQAPAERRPSEVNGVGEPSLAKRLRGTPERIELENYRLSIIQREEELEEVPEETLAEHNLSSVLDKGTDVDDGSSSSESDMEEEDEELEPAGPSDLGGVPWKDAVEIHAKLKSGSDTGAGREDGEHREGEMEGEDEEDEEDEEEEEEEEEESSDEKPLPVLVKSPGTRFFSEPFLPEDIKQQMSTVPTSPTAPIVLTPEAKSPKSLVAVTSPIRSQPAPLPETVTPKSPIQPDPCACSPSSNPLSPICAQPLPCQEPSSPLSTGSPVRTQPVPAVTSTPLVKPIPLERKTPESLKTQDTIEETPVKKADIIEEFWMKSAEIRRSLGLTPLDRSRSIIEKSKVSTPEPISPKSQTPEDLSEEMKPTFTGRSVIRRLNITLEGQVISPVEPKSNGSDRRELSTSSGLGLNGSTMTSQTATSDSYNNSDSTMLTPPSSPPPPPPNEEPATLTKKPLVTWDNLFPAPRTNPPVVMRTKDPNKPRREEVRKSFVECVEEIPFADDVEDTYDDRTPDTSAQDRFYTPPTSKVNRDRGPPLHLALAMENGKPNIPGALVSRAGKGPQHFSPEAKEIAEERMREREKSVKSQALKDAMAKQLNKMKEAESAKGAVAKVAWNVSEVTVKNKKRSSLPKASAVKALESKKQAEAPSDRFFTSPLNKSIDSSVTSSESSTGAKSKKRSSLFSPRKNKKEKKAKNESRLSGTEETPPKHKSLWKAVFSGYKKDKKKKDDKSCPSTPSSSTTGVSLPLHQIKSYLRLRRNLSFSEDSDLSCDDVLERSSQKSKADKTYTEEELNAKLTRRVQKAARRQAKQEELKRLHRAQIIQRQLEQVEEKQRQLEERGVAVEKALRGEAVEPYVGTPRWRPLSFCPCCTPEGMGKKDDPKLMQEWFKLVQEKNALVRYESELMIFARELELEDRQSRLQQELRERMAVDDHLKTETELAEEKQILNEMLEVVEQRDSLVALLEEQRLREKEEDKDLEAVMLSKGFNLNWA
uniref:F-actin monooxygenase n=1 Tax=Astyanax mexicanus TaxID=7994 RepID=A0A8B9KT01_ASTMX